MGHSLLSHITEAFGRHPPEKIGVAVSGGGDSMALLHLMHTQFSQNGVTLHAVTVDHGLRAEATGEAELVKSFCATIGISHDTLHWRDWDGTGNLQSEARDARYALIGNWAQQQGIELIALGHTADDQAETFLMRLSRRAGVNGLAGMSMRILRDGVGFVRPLLKVGRAELRAYLRAHKIDWAEDPSNEDTKYDRIKARQMMDVLKPLGIDAQGLAEVAGHLSQARTALKWQTFLSARDCISIEYGTVMITETWFSSLPSEIQRRLLVGALGWISNSDYPPRRAALSDVIQNLGATRTLNGCQIQKRGNRIAVFREYNAVCEVCTLAHEVWDGRWQLSMYTPQPIDANLQIRALTQEGLHQCPDWRSTGMSEAILKATPAIWADDTLISAPLAGFAQGWRAQIIGGEESFFASLVAQ